MGRTKKSRRRSGKRQEGPVSASPPADAKPLPRRWHAAALAGAAALLGVLVYWNTFDNPFVYDDLRTVVQNRSIRDLGNLSAVLRFERFRPLVNLTYAVDYAVWELRPFGYHLTSVLLHALNVALLFVVARTVLTDRARLGRPTGLPRDSLAFAAAALLAVHPMMTEAVGYVSGRSEVLCGVFFLSAFLLLRGFLVHGGGVRLAAGLVCFLLALASKEVGAMLPFVLAVYDFIFLQDSPQGRRRRLVQFHAPMLGLVLLGGAVRLWRFFAVEASTLPRSIWQNVMTEWEILWRYLGLLFLPVSQSVIHPTQRVATPWDGKALVAGAALVALAVLAFRLRGRFPLLGFGLAWFFLVLAPSSTLIPLNELMTEHRIYVASCGVFLAVVGLLSRSPLGNRPKAAGPVLVAVLLALSAATVARNKVWSDPVTLWRDASLKAPLTWRAVFGLADALHQRGDCAGAVVPYAQAIRLQPDDLGTRMNLGICLAQTGRYDEAEVAFTEALEVDPHFVKAYNNLGRLSMITGRVRLGERYFHQALDKDPQNVTAKLNLIRLYEGKKRDPAEILRLCREVAAVERRAPGIEDCLRKYGN